MSQLRIDQTARNLIISIGSQTILKLRPSIKTNTYKDERSTQIIVVFLLKIPVVPFHFSSKLVVELHSGVNPTIWWGVRHGDESGGGQPAGRFGCRSYIRTGGIPQVAFIVVSRFNGYRRCLTGTHWLRMSIHWYQQAQPSPARSANTYEQNKEEYD